jgi:hypothetical protein
MQLHRLIYFHCQLYMFRAMFSPIIRNTRLYLQYLVVENASKTPAGNSLVNTTRYCKYRLVLLMIDENIARNI